jgi:hypothetical protein
MREQEGLDYRGGKSILNYLKYEVEDPSGTAE